MSNNLNLQTSFFQALRFFYEVNKTTIRRNYNDLTRKYLDYNDRKCNPDAFLRKPQFEALEMYVFIKEYLNNQSVSEIFKDWMEKKGCFSDSKLRIRENDQIDLFEYSTREYKEVYEMLIKYKEAYSNYIFALTMGLGKTILMATCIFYEFLLANKYPNDPRFCHNALVFSPDKTVLQSLKEIQTFDKSKVIPNEYVRILDSNIKFHFLEETGTTLNTLDDSDFNIIISNNQKIILKKKHTEDTPVQMLFSDSDRKSEIDDIFSALYGVEQHMDEGDLIFNQRFEKITRLSQLGIYVDEAHHLFGKQLDKDLYDKGKSSLRTTINVLANRLNQKGSRVVACYNYTGTPYVGNTILPEVVYSYGLKESIANGYLKDAEPQAFDNVKNETFIRRVVKDFWDTYGEKRYEKMLPKLAIYGSEIKEVEEEIVPTLEKILEEMDISRDKILINVGDSKLTKDNDINEFNNLDTEKSNKQFIILVGKGKEGWNCRSLFGVALYRSPDSSIFVLQATMRCLRKITNVQQTASVYLSKDNYEILDNELNKNFKMSVKDIKNKENDGKVEYEVRVIPPPRFIKIKKINNKYNLVKKYNEHDSINLELDKIDLEKYKARIIRKESLADSRVAKVKEIDISDENIQYSEIMLCSEISRYIGDLKCTEIKKILRNDINDIIELVSKYNQILYDWIIPKIVDFVYELEKYTTTEDKDVILLKEPEEEYYTFKAKPELVITNSDLEILGVKNKSFHADTYCFDSKPEKELFLQYIKNKKIKEIYFTGMFTNAAQTDFYIQYIDPDSNTLRKYYPDFVAKFENNTYEIIEVKGDNKIDDAVVNAKKDAAMEIASESDMIYTIYKSSSIMEENVLDEGIRYSQEEIDRDELMVAEEDEDYKLD